MVDTPPFRYESVTLDETTSTITCRYTIGDERFVEVAVIPEGELGRPGVAEAAELYFWLAGVSYLKTRAPLLVDLGDHGSTAAERAFLRSYLVHGLGEFALKNDLDLSSLRVEGPERTPTPIATGLGADRVLIPFGGGLDSIVTVAELAPLADEASLFVAERPGARFEAIERPAAVTGLPVLRAERLLDDKVLSSSSHGYLNGHVPVTGVLSALAVVTALATGHGAVAMSNERSASSATTMTPTGPVNHQWSKGLEFERGFRALLAGRLDGIEYFSWLRDRSELSIASVMAGLDEYYLAFRSCNRSFHQDPAARLDRWCGVCDKCLFIDLALSPFLAPSKLRAIFDGVEPLENLALRDQLEVLVGTAPGMRPFECVGDEAECRSALLLAAARPDRADNEMLQAIAERVEASPSEPEPASLPTFIPDRYAARARLG